MEDVALADRALVPRLVRVKSEVRAPTLGGICLRAGDCG